VAYSSGTRTSIRWRTVPTNVSPVNRTGSTGRWRRPPEPARSAP
jgi:hypothetical protein